MLAPQALLAQQVPRVLTEPPDLQVPLAQQVLMEPPAQQEQQETLGQPERLEQSDLQAQPERTAQRVQQERPEQLALTERPEPQDLLEPQVLTERQA